MQLCWFPASYWCFCYIYITWYYENYFISYLPAFSVYWHFYYFFTTRHFQNWHQSVPSCGCASCWRATGIFAIYINWHTQNVIILSSSDILCILTFLLFFHNLVSAEPALECASMWLCQSPAKYRHYCYLYHLAYLECHYFIIIRHSLYTSIIIIYS